MVLLYILAGCFLLCLGSAEDVYQEDPSYEGHSRHEYPNPMSVIGHAKCHRTEKSYICDPDSIISPLEANQLNEELKYTVEELRCPCSRYSCIQHDSGGYKVGVALMKKMKPEKSFDEWEAQEKSEKSWEDKRRDWLLGEAKLFAAELLKEWKLGHCTEDVIVLYSLDDEVLYTAVGDVARVKLNATVIIDVSGHARSEFSHSGSVFKGLLKIVRDYRSVFQNNYQLGRPQVAPLRRNHAVSLMKCSGSFTAVVVLLLSSFAVVLHHIVVGGTQ